jgi:hypothetical protein
MIPLSTHLFSHWSIPLKGLGHQMNNFLKAYEIFSVFCVHALLFENFYDAWSKRKIDFVCFYENPTNSKNTSRNPLQMHRSGDFDIKNAYTLGYFSSKLGYVSSKKKASFYPHYRSHITLTTLPPKNISNMFAAVMPTDSREITTLLRPEKSGIGGQILPTVGR